MTKLRFTPSWVRFVTDYVERLEVIKTAFVTICNRHTVYLARIELVQTCMHCPDYIHANEEGRYTYQY